MFRKQESYTIKEFMDRGQVQPEPKLKLKKGTIYKVILVSGLTTITLLLSGFDVAQAASVVDGGESIDIAARKIYAKLLLVGKWIIIIKGGIDTVNNVVQGDAQGAKRNFLGYLIVYLILNGLPWAMDEVDKVFNQM